MLTTQHKVVQSARATDSVVWTKALFSVWRGVVYCFYSSCFTRVGCCCQPCSVSTLCNNHVVYFSTKCDLCLFFVGLFTPQCTKSLSLRSNSVVSSVSDEVFSSNLESSSLSVFPDLITIALPSFSLHFLLHLHFGFNEKIRICVFSDVLSVLWKQALCCCRSS